VHGNRKVLSSIAALAIVLLLPGYLNGGPVPIQIEIMAAKPSWSDSEFVGHAFMCISLPVEAGSKEDFYGFYPKNGGKGMIFGPGVINSETAHNPGRFSRVVASFKRPITEEQRRAILKLADEWNSKNYSLMTRSCIDFVDSVVRKLGWNPPARVATDFPEDYVRKLIAANPR
jgi:hypothetical protein